MTDVGGLKSRRRKWVDHFSCCTAIFFVASLPDYMRPSERKASRPALRESLGVFQDVCNERALRRVPIILMLNKRDIFERILEATPLSSCFKSYDGGSSVKAGLAHIMHRFEKVHHKARTSEGYEFVVHVTVATDTEGVRNMLRLVVRARARIPPSSCISRNVTHLTAVGQIAQFGNGAFWLPVETILHSEFF